MRIYKCARCGAVISPTKKTCPYCGASLVMTKEMHDYVYAKPGKSDILVGIVIMLIFFLPIKLLVDFSIRQFDLGFFFSMAYPWTYWGVILLIDFVIALFIIYTDYWRRRL